MAKDTVHRAEVAGTQYVELTNGRTPVLGSI